jgi:hypothetical protein
MLDEKTKELLRQKGREDLIEIDEINQSGYAGCDSNGSIVDRRKCPDAVPIAKNSMLGLPEPKQLPAEPHPEYFI